MTSPLLTVSLTMESHVAIVRVNGSVDLKNSPSLRSSLLALTDRNPAKVIIDLSGVAYVDSAGVGTLVEFKRRLDRVNGGCLVLSALQPRVRSVLEITKLDQFFTIVSDLDEARKL